MLRRAKLWPLQLMLLCAALQSAGYARMLEGDSCSLSRRNTLRGICLPGSKCTTLETAIEQRIFSENDIENCGFTIYEEMICCPQLQEPPAVGITRSGIINSTYERPAVRACRELESRLKPVLVTQILEGYTAEAGEFPHMAAIAFPSSDKTIPYKFNCGGSLIAPKFVLTAAHCISNDEYQPIFVRLGTVNIEQRNNSDSSDIRVQITHLHPNYSSLANYDDIGLVELVENARESDFIRPVCLHTLADVEPTKPKYFVTGWGIMNVTTRDISQILLQAEVNVVPLHSCNTTYANEAAFKLSRLSRGLLQTQMCAQNSNMTDVACKGDSGGPLNLLMDLTHRTYRVVGITSFGFGCGGIVPGLYTRVAAYLEYIEKIVWPEYT